MPEPPETTAQPAAHTPRASEAVISELMMPNQVNPLGHVFGGVVLSMIDRAAAVAAMRHSRRPVVTASIERVDFRQPIYSGELVTCCAHVDYVGRTSMEVEVVVEAENPLTGERRHTNTCYLTFVAIDEQHRPVPVPRLELETDDDRRRARAGELRRETRRRWLEQARRQT
ncbi:MAG: acyl-CoA thioesterase [Gemmatimonadetes bacterium]|nr:acyl-CoA thioesterase [Gemmatimonadota bacterium]